MFRERKKMRLFIAKYLLSYKIFSPYCKDEKGNFSILAALSLGVLALFVAVAVEFSFLTNNHSELQDLSDHASFAAARFYGETNDKEGALEFADKFLTDALLTRPWHEDVQISVSLEQGNKLAVVAQSTTRHALGGLLGRKTTPISVLSEVTLSDPTTAEISVVVDVTSSMIEQMRFFPAMNALDDFISVLTSSDNSDLLTGKVSIVPFSSRINYGLSNADFFNGPAPDRWTDAQPYDNLWKLNSWRAQNGERGYSKNQHNMWLGCAEPAMDVAARDGNIIPLVPVSPTVVPLSYQDDNIDSTNAITGESFCPPPVTPLTNNVSVLRSAIDDMTSQGATRLDVGLMGGWETLSPNFANNWPSERGTNASVDQKYLVFMSDGGMNPEENSGTRHFDWICTGSDFDINQGASQNACRDFAKQNFISICNNIKAEGIKIFTIAYSSNADAELMRECASHGAEFYREAESGNVDDVYESIARTIGNYTMRLSR